MPRPQWLARRHTSPPKYAKTSLASCMCDGQGCAIGMCMRSVGQKPCLRPARISMYREATGAHRCGYQRLGNAVALQRAPP